MATLEKIRNRAGILVSVVIGLALVAFILGDILGSGTSLFSNKQFEIAEIGGNSVSFQELQTKIDKLTEIYKMNTGETALTSEIIDHIFEQAWQQLINDHVMGKEFEKLGIVVSSDELFDMVQGQNIHPIILQIFTDPSTGMFNNEALQNFLRNMHQDPSGASFNYWLFVENEIVDERKATKFNNLVQQGLFVTSVQARNAHYESNKQVDFEFILQRFTAIADSLAIVSDKEIRDYYRRNKDDFQQEHTRDIEFVSFDIVPSEEDNLEAKKWIENIVAEFSTTADIKQFTNFNSDIPFNESNFNYGELPETINNFMFNAQVGDVYGPYFEEGTYKLSRLVAINFLPDSVKARHILIQPTEALSLEQARVKADSLLTLIRRGQNFELLAIQHSTDEGSRFNGGNLGWFAEGMMVKPFNDASFAARIGEEFVVETQFGIHIVEVLERSREVKNVQVATLAREVSPSTATYQRIFNQASTFAATNNTYEKFQTAVETQGLSIQSANNLLPADKQIPGLESPREMIRWAFNSNEQSVSQVFEFGQSFIVATVTRIREKGTQPLENVKMDIEILLRKEKKGSIIASQFQNELKSATSLDQIAQNLNLNINSASQISFASFSIPNAGIEPKVIAKATAKEQGQLSEPIIGENGVYLIRVTNIQKPESADYELYRSRLETNFNSRVGFEAFESLKKNANIKDNRVNFF